MHATTIQLCLYDRMHRRKIPHHCSPLLSSGPDKEDIKGHMKRYFVIRSNIVILHIIYILEYLTTDSS